MKALIKNLIRFCIYTVVAFTLLKFGIGYYILDLCFTVFILFTYYAFSDLVCSLTSGRGSKRFEALKKLAETSKDLNRYYVTVLIYLSSVLTPMLYLLVEKVFNMVLT